MNTTTPSKSSQPPSGKVLGSAPSYLEKRERAVKIAENVRRINEVAPKGAKGYIKERQRALKEMKERL